MRPVPEYDQKTWLLKALRETPHAMESLLWDIDDDSLERRLASDEWSCRDLVVHLREMERRYIGWLERMVHANAPRIEAFDADSIARDLTDYDETCGDERIFDAMDEFSMHRRQAVQLLWSLDPEDWERHGVHPYLGALTITQVARAMNEHDLAHLWQLRRLCDRLEPVRV